MSSLRQFVAQWVGGAGVAAAIFVATLVMLVCLVLIGGKRNYVATEIPDRGIHKHLPAILLILLVVTAVLLVGIRTPQVMIGDEVTHFYMLKTQAGDLSKPNFTAEIPLGGEQVEQRRYPHSFLWHYCGAVIYKLTGGSFVAIQLFQTAFLLQLLVVSYLLAREQSLDGLSSVLYLAVIGFLPVTLLFSVAFYQDIPLTAQVVTAFYLLRKGRWLWASLFLAFALGIKVTALLFFPSFFVLLWYWQIKKTGWLPTTLALVCAAAILLGANWGIGLAINKYGQTYYYPQAQLESVVKKSKHFIEQRFKKGSEKELKSKPKLTSAPSNTEESKQSVKRKTDKKRSPVIANHPGDLRIKENYVLYGGLVFWSVIPLGFLGYLWRRPFSYLDFEAQPSHSWLYFTGATYLVLVIWFARTSPDARFFFPGLPFIVLPLAQRAAGLPKAKWLVVILVALAITQGAYVLKKTYRLRVLSPELTEAIQYLDNQPGDGHIFMYPEGNYRFFSRQHEWYLGYRLKHFWRGGNDERIKLLRKFKVEYIVIKKHLVAPVDQNITNLGVYPPRFVKEIQVDTRFQHVFENDLVGIYKIETEID